MSDYSAKAVLIKAARIEALETRIEELEAAIHDALPALELGGRWHEYTGHLTIDEDTVAAVEEARGFLLAVMGDETK
jgi:hypothetical protein